MTIEQKQKKKKKKSKDDARFVAFDAKELNYLKGFVIINN